MSMAAARNRRSHCVRQGRESAYVNSSALFSEVLSSTGVEGSSHTADSILNAQLVALCVLGSDCGSVVEDSLGQVVDIILGSGSINDQGSLDGDSGHISFLAGVGAGGDGIGGVEGAVSHDFLCDLAVNGNQVCIVGGAQLGDSGGGSAGNDECSIDLAVLQSVGGVSEALVFLLKCRH